MDVLAPRPILLAMLLLGVACRSPSSARPAPEATTPPPTSTLAAPSVIGSVSPADATTPVSVPSLAVTAPRPYTVVDASTGFVPPDNPGKWVAARVASVRAGVPELVRIPIHRRQSGYGCACPWFSVGSQERPVAEGEPYAAGPDVEPIADTAGDPYVDGFIDPKPGPDGLLPESIRYGKTIVAEGYFTGKIHVEKGDVDEKFELDEFRVIRARAPLPPKTDGGDTGIAAADARVVVLARGADAMQEAPRPADGKIFLVVVESISLASPDAYEKARAKTDALRDRFPEAEVIDSRNVPGFFCCNYVVVLSRWATDKEARDAAAHARTMGVTTSVRRGWLSS